jgi:hypothetical protein
VSQHLSMLTAWPSTVPGALIPSNASCRLLQTVCHTRLWRLDLPFPQTKHCVHFTLLHGVHPHPTLHLDGSTLPFAPFFKFICLLDMKLMGTSSDVAPRYIGTFTEHIKSFIWVVRGWDGKCSVTARMSTLELDYGSFMYGSTMKSRLSVIDSVHNTGIRLATGCLSRQPS